MHTPRSFRGRFLKPDPLAVTLSHDMAMATMRMRVWMAWIIFVFTIAASVIQTISCLKPIFIAGLFNPFDVNGFVDMDQMEHLGVFMAAIDNINKDQTILPGYEIKYMIRSGHQFSGASKTANNVLISGYDIVAVIGALPFVETSAIDNIFADHQLVMAHSVAMDTELGKCC